MYNKNNIFPKLLSSSLLKYPKEKSIVNGKIINIFKEHIYVDIDAKSEGKIPINEFYNSNPFLGQKIKVYLDKLENKNGYIQVSKNKVAKELAWNNFENCIFRWN